MPAAGSRRAPRDARPRGEDARPARADRRRRRPRSRPPGLPSRTGSFPAGCARRGTGLPAGPAVPPDGVDADLLVALCGASLRDAPPDLARLAARAAGPLHAGTVVVELTHEGARHRWRRGSPRRVRPARPYRRPPRRHTSSPCAASRRTGRSTSTYASATCARSAEPQWRKALRGQWPPHLTAWTSVLLVPTSARVGPHDRDDGRAQIRRRGGPPPARYEHRASRARFRFEPDRRGGSRRARRCGPARRNLTYLVERAVTLARQVA